MPTTDRQTRCEFFSMRTKPPQSVVTVPAQNESLAIWTFLLILIGRFPI